MGLLLNIFVNEIGIIVLSKQFNITVEKTLK